MRTDPRTGRASRNNSRTACSPTTVPPARYRYRVAGTDRPLQPDLVPDPRGSDGWITTSTAGPFDGRTVGWKALTLLDAGVDLECQWHEPTFVDRLVFDPAVLAGVSRIRVLVDVAGRMRQFGQLDLSATTTDEFELEGRAEVCLDVGRPLTSCVIRFETRLRDLVLSGGILVAGVAVPGVGAFPAPARRTVSGPGPAWDRFSSAVVRAFAPTEGSNIATEIAQHLVDRALEVLDQPWSSGRPGVLPPSVPGTGGAIAIELGGVRADDAAVAEIVTTLGTIASEGFGLHIDADRVVIVGDGRGLRYGAEAVLQQLIMDGALLSGTVVDEPAHSFRGVHLPLPAPDRIDLFRALVRWLLVPMRFNTIILEVAGGMEFVRHPEINDAWRGAYASAIAGEQPMPAHFDMVSPGACLPQATVASLADELRAMGLEVIPELQSLSHVEYLTIPHPEIAEVPDASVADEVDLFTADQPSWAYPTCYCPSNPASQELILDVLTEILDVFRPQRYVHLGHDEVYQLGVCPRCRTKDPADLFADDVNRLCAVVAERGLQPIIWSDMLQPEAPYRAAAALDQLPADLIMMDFIWYFHRETDTERHLLSHGRPVVIGNLYSSHFPRWDSRSRQPGLIGGQVSTWIPIDDDRMGFEGKYFDIAMVGVWLWSAQHHRHHRLSATDRIVRYLPEVRERLTRGTTARVGYPDAGVEILDQQAALTTPSVGTAGCDPVLAAITSRVDGPVTFPGGGPSTGYRIAAPVSLPPTGAMGRSGRCLTLAVPAGMREIHVIHALTRPVPRIPWKPPTEVGRYRFHDASGADIGVLPVTAGGTADHLHRRYATPLPTSYYRHHGYTGTYRVDPVWLGQTDEGADLCLSRVVWRAPEGVEPAAVTVEIDDDAGTSLVVASITALPHGEARRTSRET